MLPADLVARWRVPAAARTVLSQVGLPRFGDVVPCPQRSTQPLAAPYYVLGRHDVQEHVHLAELRLDCGCGMFGLSEIDGSVWQMFPGSGEPPLFVNSSLEQFVYFLHMLGAA